MYLLSLNLLDSIPTDRKILSKYTCTVNGQLCISSRSIEGSGIVKVEGSGIVKVEGSGIVKVQVLFLWGLSQRNRFGGIIVQLFRTAPSFPLYPQCGAKVYQIFFSMRQYGAASIKPTMVMTNNKAYWALALDLGKLKRRIRKTARPTTKKYKDSKGRNRFVGTSRLKASQSLQPLLDYVVSLFGWGVH